MRNSKLKLTLTAVVLVGSAALFSAFAYGEGADMMADHSERNGMMSSHDMEDMGGMMGMMKDMGGMMGMMGMMSDMSPEDRKAMTKACMKMMQRHSGMKDNTTDSND